ncbi:MAG: glycine cleavage system protein T [Thermoplasmatales archaeon B_DKE]|nr:MAG: glycine cleavage system protein T [Thermoplasmatales archaeon B_DKE]
MRRTCLYEEHIKLGGKMVDFHGWEMPLQYSRILEEHMAVRKAFGIFDVSHMGDIVIEGNDSIKFVDYLFPTKVSKLVVGQSLYTAFLTEDGIIIDDTIIYRLSENKFFFVPNAGTIELIYKWVMDHSTGFNVKISNVSYDIGSIAVQGPKAVLVLKEMKYSSPEQFKFSYEKSDHVNKITGEKNIIVSGTGYTGENGVEIIGSNEDIVNIWQRLAKLLPRYSGLPCGLGSRDTLRMEKGMLLSGVDFYMNRDPFECSISFIVDTDHEFIGKEKLMKRKLTDKEIFRGFILGDKSIPRAGFPVELNGKTIGKITSGTLSPILDKGIGLGFIDKQQLKPGMACEIKIREANHGATVSKPKIVP